MRDEKKASGEGGWSLLVRMWRQEIGEGSSRPRVWESHRETQKEIDEDLRRLLSGKDLVSREAGWLDLGEGRWERRAGPWRIQATALSPKGRWASVPDLLKSQRRLREAAAAERARRRRGEAWNGEGPVPGSGRGADWRRGWRAGTQKDRGFSRLREDRVAEAEDREPKARAARSGKAVGNRFDRWEYPFWRRPQKNWKAQGKGARQWDRGA